MGKHIIDQPRESASPDIVDRYRDIDKRHAEPGSHPAAKAAHRKPATRADKRTSQFVRIERGREA